MAALDTKVKYEEYSTSRFSINLEKLLTRVPHEFLKTSENIHKVSIYLSIIQSFLVTFSDIKAAQFNYNPYDSIMKASEYHLLFFPPKKKEHKVSAIGFTQNQSLLTSNPKIFSEAPDEINLGNIIEMCPQIIDCTSNLIKFLSTNERDNETWLAFNCLESMGLTESSKVEYNKKMLLPYLKQLEQRIAELNNNPVNFETVQINEEGYVV